MASVEAFPSLYSFCRTNNCFLISNSTSLTTSVHCLRLGTNRVSSRSLHFTRKKNTEFRRIRSVTEETLVPEEQKEETPVDQPVSIPVSPSDMLSMFFQAEGIMDESAIPTVAKALEV
uniref:Uncharacterized protein n=1 Tax=Nelumbo nucifera TaxID=4432 RepID=A0A822YP36_NELNU|nr:TPA_asm: hypothetical protein HUJ06_009879 [Nelumbo nucifera]